MNKDLAGKVAVVTGGASGIGLGAVELFARHGAKVVVADVNAERGDALAERLGGAVRFRRADVSNADDVQAVVDMAVSEFGGLHVMFNNAGVSGPVHSRFLDDDLSDFQGIIGVNLLGAMLGSQRAGRHMAKNGGGSIINTASIGASVPSFGVMTYRASKAAIIQFTKSLAIDLGEYGIRVNSVSPGNIATQMATFSSPGMDPALVERIRLAMLEHQSTAQPLKRQGTVEDIAQAALFLASDRSAHITGQDIIVDGGRSVGDAVNRMERIKATIADVMASHASLERSGRAAPIASPATSS